MISLFHPILVRCLFQLGCAFFLTVGSVLAQESPLLETAETVAPSTETATNAPSQAEAETMLALQELRTQQAEALKAIEELRRDTLAASQRNDEAMSARLKLIQESMATNWTADLQEIRQAGHDTLILVGATAGVALLSMLVVMLYLLSVMKRLAEAAAVFPATHPLLRGGNAGALPGGDTGLTANDPAGLTTGRLMEVIHKLEKNVRELEHGNHAQPVAAATPGENGGAAHLSPAVANSSSGPGPEEERAAKVSSLMGKANTLLNMGQAEDALICYEEVIGLDETNTEALVKRGKALEKLRRMEEAIESYDRALIVDDSLTIAHLGKGGVLNRLERYSEALECYEKAMQSQQQQVQPAG